MSSDMLSNFVRTMTEAGQDKLYWSKDKGGALPWR